MSVSVIVPGEDTATGAAAAAGWEGMLLATGAATLEEGAAGAAEAAAATGAGLGASVGFVCDICI